MRRKRVFLLGILLGTIFLVNIGIVSLQDSSKPGIIHYDLTENVPMLLLGSFRGVAVDFLWARAIVRHEEKKYYELLTINNLISKLQPNFPAVWIFQAWNMAYNIAHEWDAPQNAIFSLSLDTCIYICSIRGFLPMQPITGNS